MTAVQLAAAVGAVANRGLMMKPYLVREILGPQGGTVKTVRPQVLGRVMSPETASVLIRMMEGVVTDEGTGKRAEISGFRVAGKTGTAQKLDPVKGTYSNDHHLAVFVGLVPVENPALVLLVVVDEPQDSPFGGVVAAPVFASVAEQALPLMGVGSRQSKRGWAQIVKGGGEPLSGSEKITVAPVVQPESGLKSGQESQRMPRLVGMSMRDAVRVATNLGLRPEVEGSGRVVWQSPDSGHSLKGVDSCRLVLKAEAS